MRAPCRCFGFSSVLSCAASGSVGSAWIASWISAFDASNCRLSPFSERGRDGGGSLERGGGGIGALLASPTRKRVMVSCASVGTPLKIVLRRDQ